MHAGSALQYEDRRGKTNEEATARMGGGCDLKVSWTIVEAVEMERKEERGVIQGKRGREEGKARMTW